MSLHGFVSRWWFAASEPPIDRDALVAALFQKARPRGHVEATQRRVKAPPRCSVVVGPGPPCIPQVLAVDVVRVGETDLRFEA